MATPDPAARASEAPAAPRSASPGGAASARPTSSSSSSSPALRPDPASWAKDWPKTWTDPRVVDALAATCGFVPEVRPPLGDEWERAPDLFRCVIGKSQSCTPDFCFSAETTCEQDCSAACVDCGGACTRACEACKSSCSDPGCNHRCAETCAQCKQRCETGLDHCSSAECGKKHAECQKKVEASWKRNGCSARCRGFQGCTTACDKAKDPDACRERCEGQLAPGWKACHDRCEALRDAQRFPEADACLGACYQTVPCAPFICMMGTMN